MFLLDGVHGVKDNHDMKPHKLTAVRTKLGLSKTALARAIGVSVPTVSMWEGGHNPFPVWAQRLISLLLKSKEAREHYGISGD